MSDFKKILRFFTGGNDKEEASKNPTGMIEPSFIRETGTFSQRLGIKKVERISEMSSMPDELKNSLWNAVVQHFFPSSISEPYSVPVREDKEFFSLIEKLWINFFKFPAHVIMYDYIGNAMNELRNSYVQLRWNEVYDFIEFLVQNNDSITSKPVNDFVKLCNDVLEREYSLFRIINKRITPRQG